MGRRALHDVEASTFFDERLAIEKRWLDQLGVENLVHVVAACKECLIFGYSNEASLFHHKAGHHGKGLCDRGGYDGLLRRQQAQVEILQPDVLPLETVLWVFRVLQAKVFRKELLYLLLHAFDPAIHLHAGPPEAIQGEGLLFHPRHKIVVMGKLRFNLKVKP